MRAHHDIIRKGGLACYFLKLQLLILLSYNNYMLSERGRASPNETSKSKLPTK